MKDDNRFHDTDPDELDKIEDELFDYQSEIDEIEAEEKAYREQRSRKLKERREKGITSDFEKYEEKMRAEEEALAGQDARAKMPADLKDSASEVEIPQPAAKEKAAPEAEPKTVELPGSEAMPEAEPKTVELSESETVPEAEPKTVKIPEEEAVPEPEPKTVKIPEEEAMPEAEPKTAEAPEAKAAPEAEPKPEPVKAPEAKAAPEAEPKPEPVKAPEAKAAPEAEPKTAKAPEAKVAPEAEPKTAKAPEAKAAPEPEPVKAPEAKAAPKPEPEKAPEAKTAPKPEPERTAAAQAASKPEPKTAAVPEEKAAPETAAQRMKRQASGGNAPVDERTHVLVGTGTPDKHTREQQEEIDWLGETFDGDPSALDKPEPAKKKKKSKKPVIITLVVIAVAAVIGLLAYRIGSDKKLAAAFSDKTESFRSEKIEGVTLGIHEQYFTDFLDQCDNAISQGDVSAMRELNGQWDDVEKEYDTVIQGKNDLDEFAGTVKDAFSNFIITDEYRDQCDALTASIESAQNDVDYDQLQDLKDMYDQLSTNLKSSSLAELETKKNEISVIEYDDSQLSDEDRQKIQDYSTQADQQIDDGQYSAAMETLTAWQSFIQGISDQQAAAAEAARQQAESESAAVESIIAQQNLPASQQTQQAPASSEDATADTDSSDYIFPDSDSRYLTDADVSGLSKYQLMIARNEIYARHGWIFQNEELYAYFSSKSWYHGTTLPKDFSPSVLNEYEKANIALILSYEN